jgi:transcriptional regulator with XRE-family HTH domain
MRRVRPQPSPRLVEALARFGAGLRNLRLRRRMPMGYAADLARISRSTLHKLERGDPGVSLGIYAGVLETYGRLEWLVSLTEARWDRVGLALDETRLPQRVRGAARMVEASE